MRQGVKVAFGTMLTFLLIGLVAALLVSIFEVSADTIVKTHITVPTNCVAAYHFSESGWFSMRQNFDWTVTCPTEGK